MVAADAAHGLNWFPVYQSVYCRLTAPGTVITAFSSAGCLPTDLVVGELARSDLPGSSESGSRNKLKGKLQMEPYWRSKFRKIISILIVSLMAYGNGFGVAAGSSDFMSMASQDERIDFSTAHQRIHRDRGAERQSAQLSKKKKVKSGKKYEPEDTVGDFTRLTRYRQECRAGNLNSCKITCARQGYSWACSKAQKGKK